MYVVVAAVVVIGVAFVVVEATAMGSSCCCCGSRCGVVAVAMALVLWSWLRPSCGFGCALLWPQAWFLLLLLCLWSWL